MLTGCREYRKLLIELARNTVTAHERRVLMTHVEECADCARALDGQLALSASLGDMASEAFPEIAGIEVRVLAEFDRMATRRPVVRMYRWTLVAGLATAMLAGVVLRERRKPVAQPEPRMETAAMQTPLPVPPPRPRPPVQRVSHRAAPPQASADADPFVAIPYTVPLAAEERATIVRMEIPVAALIAAGFSVPVSDPGGVVEADVLVSGDGRARAIRPISISTSR
jgi:Putative zinc-finger